MRQPRPNYEPQNKNFYSPLPYYLKQHEITKN